MFREVRAVALELDFGRQRPLGLEVAPHLRRQHGLESLRAVLGAEAVDARVALLARHAPVRGELEQRDLAFQIERRRAGRHVEPAWRRERSADRPHQLEPLDLGLHRGGGVGQHVAQLLWRAAQQLEGFVVHALAGQRLRHVDIRVDHARRDGPAHRGLARLGRFDQPRRVLDDAGIDVVETVVILQRDVRRDLLVDERIRHRVQLVDDLLELCVALRAGLFTQADGDRRRQGGRPRRRRLAFDRRARDRSRPLRARAGRRRGKGSARSPRSLSAAVLTSNFAAHDFAIASRLVSMLLLAAMRA